MEPVRVFIEQQPLLSLFLVISLGYALGQINIKGFSLGVGAVLFSGLAIGAWAPRAQPPGLLGTMGLVLFLYGIGVQFGKQFFRGLTGAEGRRYNLLALAAMAVAGGVTVVQMIVMQIPTPFMAGLFAGSGTNAASMQAALEAARNNDPAIGYSVAYPFGIVGAILCMYLLQVLLKPTITARGEGQATIIEVAIRSSDAIGKTLGEVMPKLPVGVHVHALRTRHENTLPSPEIVLGDNDVLLLGSKDSTALEAARRLLGEHAPGRLLTDRSNLDYVNVFVSRDALVGRRISDLVLPPGIEAQIIQVRRGDADLMAAPDLILEFGDRVGLVAHRNHFEAVRKFFGNSIRGTTEVSYVSLGIGMVLGVLLGVIPFPVPGLGIVKLGIAGGSLIAALILGRLGRTGVLTWTMPLSANLTLRNFGLSIFLAQVGLTSGPMFLGVVQESGMKFILVGALILLALVFTVLLIGHRFMRIPFDDLLGVTSGVTGSSAILAYAYKAVPSERVEICYSLVYPSATILKIVFAQLLIAMCNG